MVEIKDSTFIVFADTDGCDTISCRVKYKLQILQDHEDAKKLRNENQSLKYERIDLIVDCKKYREDAEKWEENMKLLSRNINDDLKQVKKDRQIVKRLEEHLAFAKNIRKGIINEWDLKENSDITNELQKILEGKK